VRKDGHAVAEGRRTLPPTVSMLRAHASGTAAGVPSAPYDLQWRDTMAATAPMHADAPDAFQCPFPACGRRFTSGPAVDAHVQAAHVAGAVHAPGAGTASKPRLHTVTEADAFLRPMWDAVGLSTLLLPTGGR
jgi:hypothetical protein